ncbi:MAG: DUF4422 domain-containing protein [Alphaproteobacteria bacterium]|nr:DUF4422 domain-containing protein [Alphaproteobacteria bacterium]
MKKSTAHFLTSFIPIKSVRKKVRYNLKHMNDISDNFLKILQVYHKEDLRMKSPFIQSIQVGRAINKVKLKGMIGDDTGDNISNQNPYYCELTAQYWAWKNIDKLNNPEYVGLMHYRRVFNFEKKKTDDLRKLNYSKKYLYNQIKNYDVIVGEKMVCYSPIASSSVENVREHWNIERKEKDLWYIYNRVCNLYPEYKDAFDKIMNCEKIS